MYSTCVEKYEEAIASHYSQELRAKPKSNGTDFSPVLIPQFTRELDSREKWKFGFTILQNEKGMTTLAAASDITSSDAIIVSNCSFQRTFTWTWVCGSYFVRSAQSSKSAKNAVSSSRFGVLLNAISRNPIGNLIHATWTTNRHICFPKFHHTKKHGNPEPTLGDRHPPLHSNIEKEHVSYFSWSPTYPDWNNIHSKIRKRRG